MVRMTSNQMMGQFGGRVSGASGLHMPPPPDGRTGPLPPGSGSKDFSLDESGDQDGDITATSGPPMKLPGGMTQSRTSLRVRDDGNRDHPTATRADY